MLRNITGREPNHCKKTYAEALNNWLIYFGNLNNIMVNKTLKNITCGGCVWAWELLHLTFIIKEHCKQIVVITPNKICFNYF